jgi:hypothetical protein
MPGLDPGIHDSLLPRRKDVDGRVKPGHDEMGDFVHLMGEALDNVAVSALA